MMCACFDVRLARDAIHKCRCTLQQIAMSIKLCVAFLSECAPIYKRRLQTQSFAENKDQKQPGWLSFKRFVKLSKVEAALFTSTWLEKAAAVLGSEHVCKQVKSVYM